MVDTATPPEAEQPEETAISSQDTINAAGTPTNLPATAPQSQQIPQTPAQSQQPPTVLIPRKRGGILGLTDDILDVLVGKDQRPQSYVDPNTNEVYVQTPPMSRGQQWMKIGAEAMRGAAAGYAAGQGAGGAGRAAQAGIQAGMQMKKDQDQEAKDEYGLARQQAIDKANSQAMKLKNTADAFRFAREQRTAIQEDIDRAHKEDDWYRSHGAVPIDGIYDGNNYHTVKVAWPSFLKDHHQDDAIHQVDDIDEKDGKFKGAHFWYLDPAATESYEPAGTSVPFYQVNLDDPMQPGTRKDIVPAGPLTTKDFLAYNAAFGNQRNDDYARIDKLKTAKLKEQQDQAELTLAQNRVQNIPLEDAVLRARLQNEQLTGKNAVLTGQKTSKEIERLSQQIEAGDESSVPVLGESVPRGGMTLSSIKDRKTHDAVAAYLAQHHPNLDQTSVDLSPTDERLKTLASNALLNASEIESLITRRPDLLGALQGRISQGKWGLGTDDKDLGQLEAAIDFYGQASTGAHAIRAASARADAKEALINDLKNGPHAVMGGLEAARNSLNQFANLGKPKGLDGKPYVYGPQPNTQQAPAGATDEVHDAKGNLTGHVVNGVFVPVGK